MSYRAYLQALLQALEASRGHADVRSTAKAPPQAQPANLVVLRQVGSTQSLARRVGRTFAEEDLPVPAATFVAYEQTSGQGRLGRSWLSPPGGGIYVTLLRTVSNSQQVSRLPLLVALALARGLDPYLSQPCRLRWPNDLMVAGSKVGGILIDAFSRPEGRAVVLLGFGINACGPAPLERATTVSLHAPPSSGPGPGPGALGAALIRSVEAGLARLESEEDVSWLVEGYRASILHSVGESLRCRSGDTVHEGIFRGIDDAGYLRLETPQGMRILAAGEVPEAEEDELEGE